MADAAQSFADLLTVLLDDWKKFVKFLVLLFFACVFAFGLVYGILRSLPRSTSELKFGSGSILFSQPTKDGQEYLIVIPPQGWQETGIAVREGDHLSFEAGGRVNIDLEGLNLALEARHSADNRIIDAEKKAGRWEKERNDFAPELHYTPEDRQNIKPHWSWIDPNGLQDTKRLANPAHQRRSILPEKGYGALLAAIRETGVKPTREDAFFVGASNTCVAKRSGKLYFVANDVTYDDPDFPDLFMIDNIGFFYARVTISK
jgi:hypothetical protein